MFVATLTTIPSRINNECILAINSLLNQVDQIYLSVCTSYQRFPNIKIPDIFFQEPYFSKVTIVYNNDYGSATKYLGSLNQLICKDQWVFVCDDDQEYKEGLIERLKPILNNKDTVYQNRYNIFSKYGTSGGYIHGFVGLFVHSSVLQKLNTFPLPEFAKTIDDQWFSVFCFLNNVKISSTNIDDYKDLFQVLGENNFEKIGKDSLAKTFGISYRNRCISELEMYFKIRFSKETVPVTIKKIN
jgi:hypothetical protein